MATKPFQFGLVFLLFCSVTDIVKGEDCGQNTIVECSNGLDMSMLADTSSIDPSKINLGKLCGFITCMTNLKCEMPASQKEMVNGLQDLKKYCPDDPSKCSIVSLQTCAGNLMSKMQEQPTPEQLKEFCPTLKCLNDLSPTCEGELKTTVDMMVKSLKSVCAEGCEADKVMACSSGMREMNPSNMSKESCKQLKTTNECLKPLLPKCDDEMKKNFEMVMSAAMCCDKFIKVREDCFPENIEQLLADENMDLCKEKEDVYSCYVKSNLKCTEPIQTQNENMKKEWKQALEKCEEKGYNITISLESGKALNDPGMGINLQPSTTILVALVLAVISWWF